MYKKKKTIGLSVIFVANYYFQILITTCALHIAAVSKWVIAWFPYFIALMHHTREIFPIFRLTHSRQC